ncbi:MAG TPA: SCO family protein [Burkholderiales bacterium]|jgi:cytochrome oxidase Cu insertion factor (SCO1/SenC/PrrC family)|nr:SCO family protein [Burkholderiales bacterium]
MLGRVALSVGLFLAAAAFAAGDYQRAAAESGFVPPSAGSYRLEHIMAAPGGTVLDTDDQPKPLAHFTTGKVTVLSFMYTSCSDVWGCPFAYQVMQELKKVLDREPLLRAHLRFVSLSFDPDHDTPEAMRLYGGSHMADSGGLPWYFLTTPSPRELRPMLEGFGQDLSLVLDASGKSTGSLSHVLKVFLIDPRGSIREIYSTSFLSPQVVLNDIRTLLIEQGAAIN